MGQKQHTQRVGAGFRERRERQRVWKCKNSSDNETTGGRQAAGGGMGSHRASPASQRRHVQCRPPQGAFVCAWVHTVSLNTRHGAVISTVGARQGRSCAAAPCAGATLGAWGEGHVGVGVVAGRPVHGRHRGAPSSGMEWLVRRGLDGWREGQQRVGDGSHWVRLGVVGEWRVGRCTLVCQAVTGREVGGWRVSASGTSRAANLPPSRPVARPGSSSAGFCCDSRPACTVKCMVHARGGAARNGGEWAQVGAAASGPCSSMQGATRGAG